MKNGKCRESRVGVDGDCISVLFGLESPAPSKEGVESLSWTEVDFKY